MTRIPSLHINEARLRTILKRVSYKSMNIRELANALIQHGKPYSLTNRSIISNTAKLEKSKSRVLKSSRDDAGRFSATLTLIRRQKKHRGIALIKVGSPNWLLIKEASSLAVNFCNDFNLKRDEGFRAYISLALDKMGNKFDLRRFNAYHQYICEAYANVQELHKDITPNQTSKALIEYNKLMNETGVVQDYSKDPNILIYFLKAKQEANKAKVSIESYIKAQFVGLEWCHSTPSPSQLVGTGAIDRLNKYIKSTGIKPGISDTDDMQKQAALKLKAKWQSKSK